MGKIPRIRSLRRLIDRLESSGARVPPLAKIRPAIAPHQIATILAAWMRRAWDGHFIGPEPWDVLARIWYSDWAVTKSLVWGRRVVSVVIVAAWQAIPWPTSPVGIIGAIVAVVLVGGCCYFGFQRVPQTPLSRDIIKTAAVVMAIPGMIGGWVFFGDGVTGKAIWCACLGIVGALVGLMLGLIIAFVVASLAVVVPVDQ